MLSSLSIYCDLFFLTLAPKFESDRYRAKLEGGRSQSDASQVLWPTIIHLKYCLHFPNFAVTIF